MPPINVDNIPKELKASPRWVCWRHEVRDGKPTKVPYCASLVEKRAAVDNPATWSSFAKALKHSDEFDGIGYVLALDSGMVGIDLDKCIGADGVIEPWAMEIAERMQTYTEISPSGKGLRLWLRGVLPAGGRRKGCFEIYNAGRYLTVTGNHIPDYSSHIEDRQAVLDILYAETFPPKPPQAPRPARAVAEMEWSDQELLDKAFTATNGAAIQALWQGDVTGYENDHSRADSALCAHLAFYCGPDGDGRLDYLFRQSGLMRPKWDEKHRSDGATYGQITIEGVYAIATEFYEASDYADLEAVRLAARGEVSTRVPKCQPRTSLHIPTDLSSEQVDADGAETICQPSTTFADEVETGEGWGVISPIRPDLMPSFPVEALPAVIASYVEDVAKVVQVPVDLAAMSALATLSFAVSRRWDVQIRRSYTEPTNLYIATAMEPGSRKSSCFEAIVFPLRAAEKDLINADKDDAEIREEARKAADERLGRKRKELANADDEGKRAEISAEIARIKDETPQTAAAPRLLVEDVTTERLVGLLMEQHGSLALISSEGGIFATIGGRYSDGQANVDVYLKGHDGEPYRVDRLNRLPEHLDAVRLAMCLTVQPDVLQVLTKKREFRGRGLLGRFLYAIPADLRGRRLMDPNAPGIDVELHHEYGSVMRCLLMTPPADPANPYERHVVKLSQAALQIHTEYANRIEQQQGEEGDLRPFSDWASKLAGRVARIAACFHCLEYCGRSPQSEPVSEEHILAAWAIADYLTTHAIRAFDLMTESDSSRDAMKVLEWIRRKKPQQFTVRKCNRDLQKSLDRKTLGEALNMLALNNYIRAVENRNSNNVRIPTYEVNPLLLDKASAKTVDS